MDARTRGQFWVIAYKGYSPGSKQYWHSNPKKLINETAYLYNRNSVFRRPTHALLTTWQSIGIYIYVYHRSYNASNVKLSAAAHHLNFRCSSWGSVGWYPGNRHRRAGDFICHTKEVDTFCVCVNKGVVALPWFDNGVIITFVFRNYFSYFGFQ